MKKWQIIAEIRKTMSGKSNYKWIGVEKYGCWQIYKSDTKTECSYNFQHCCNYISNEEVRKLLNKQIKENK